MRSIGSTGIWELFIPGLAEGHKYKFHLVTSEGKGALKADPFALFSELRPSTASQVFDVEDFQWNDQDWMLRRDSRHQAPVNIYEVHLGSWRRKDDGCWMSYRDLGTELAKYCNEMGYTHVELLPIAEHPLDESWGYQTTGYYAVSSRYGNPRDFQEMVNILHRSGIGVILDWVPGHFPTDEFALARFDGTALFEHEDHRKGFHPHWNTYIPNYGRNEVSNFFIANALFWFDVMHIDGLRVDAVASMLFLDYGREGGDWISNRYGGRENLEAIEFIKHLNSITHQKFPGVMMLAEESTSFPKVTAPVKDDGLGFDYKWNMGWMNDTLNYFQTDPIYRRHHHDKLTFGQLYTYSENFALVLSHDEVVHGKCSLLNKMPGDVWQKFAGLRVLYAYMMCQPGKKLTFMGTELGQWKEWDCQADLDWNLLDYPYHKGMQRLVRDLNHFYLDHDALWEKDHDPNGFEWVDFKDCRYSVISYLRKSSEKALLCVHNFTPVYHPYYEIRSGNVSNIKEVFNSDRSCYEGSGKGVGPIKFVFNEKREKTGFSIHLPPLSTVIFSVDLDDHMEVR